MTHDIFISHSSKDKPIADAICAHLEAAGIRCWIAPRDITPGEDWPTAITRAISQSRVMVLVFSASSNSSEDVGRELFLAADSKLVIIPFKIEDVKPEPGKQYYLARTHWLDAINPPTQEQIQNLVERVRTLVPLKRPAVPEGQTQKGSTPTIAAPAGAGRAAPNQVLKERRGAAWLWLVPIGIVLLGLVVLLGLGAFSLFWKSPPASSQPTRTPGSAAALPPTVAPALSPTQFTSPTGTADPAFPKVYISEPFNDNSLDWPVGDSTGPDWQGTLAIANGVLDWQGTSLARMNVLLHPGTASLQDNLTDQEVSARFNLISEDPKGAYGLYLRGSADGHRLYAFFVYNQQFIFYVMNGDNAWKALTNFETSPTVTGPGWVKLTVQATGSHFRLFVNDQLLTELDDATIPSGQSGLILTSYAAGKQIQAQVDDFQVLLPAP